MKHSVDLGKYNVYTDIAIDLVDGDFTSQYFDINNSNNIKVSNIKIDKKMSEKIGMKDGNYITILFDDITDKDNYSSVLDSFKKNLNKIIKDLKIRKNDKCLVIGLGNRNSTPDSLGPNTIDNIIVTNQLYSINKLDKKYRRVATFSPGVMGENGIDTISIIKSLVNCYKPDFMIVIDSLVSNSIERVNKTIQITDAGIEFSKNSKINKELFKIPIISIGVPTVIESFTIVDDTIKYINMFYKNEVSKINRRMIDKILGLSGYNMMVTTKEIDFFIKKISFLLAAGINDIIIFEDI